MTKVLVIYASDYGSTRKMAEAVAEGAVGIPGVEALIRNAEETTAEDMTSSQAIIFGTPVHMGSMDWRVKKLIDTVCSGLWAKDALTGKVGAVFATGGGLGSAGGGAELAMLSLMANLAECGMILVPLPKHTPKYEYGGLHWGPYARTTNLAHEPIGVSEEQLAVAKTHGANVARVAVALAGKLEFQK
ncbi:MAG TPA: NAD(P)H-dependent oxidoreductase [Candidatus Hydrogenedentes bacterium]|nr:NAD(P)H-dependent oxidoreductase [Candidatus Hydrogenedentota bacterium]